MTWRRHCAVSICCSSQAHLSIITSHLLQKKKQILKIRSPRCYCMNSMVHDNRHDALKSILEGNIWRVTTSRICILRTRRDDINPHLAWLQAQLFACKSILIAFSRFSSIDIRNDALQVSRTTDRQSEQALLFFLCSKSRRCLVSEELCEEFFPDNVWRRNTLYGKYYM